MAYPERTRRKKPKHQLVNANWRGDVSTFKLWWRYANPSKIGLDPNVLRSRPILEGFIWNHRKIMLISPAKCTNRLIFGNCRTFFSWLVLFGYTSLSHNFTNLVFVTSSHLFSVKLYPIIFVKRSCHSRQLSLNTLHTCGLGRIPHEIHKVGLCV